MKKIVGPLLVGIALIFSAWIVSEFVFSLLEKKEAITVEKITSSSGDSYLNIYARIHGQEEILRTRLVSFQEGKSYSVMVLNFPSGRGMILELIQELPYQSQ